MIAPIGVFVVHQEEEMTNKPMKQKTTLPEQDKSQTGKTEVSEAQPTVGRFAEIPYDQFTPEQQEACRALIEAEGLEPGAALPSAPQNLDQQPEAFQGVGFADLPPSLPAQFSESA